MSTKLAIMQSGGANSSMSVADEVFAVPFNEGLVHEVVTALMANRRADTSMQKNRSTRRGGGAKPWRQKGTGRARAGSIRSPLWRGGGATFGNQKADHSKKINKKAQRVALKAVFSELVRQDRLVVVDEFAVDEPKTKLMKAYLAELGLSNALIISEAFDEKTYLSVRNIPYIDMITFDEIYLVSLIVYEKVVVTKAVVKMIEEWLS